MHSQQISFITFGGAGEHERMVETKLCLALPIQTSWWMSCAAASGPLLSAAFHNIIGCPRTMCSLKIGKVEGEPWQEAPQFCIAGTPSVSSFHPLWDGDPSHHTSYRGSAPQHAQLQHHCLLPHPALSWGAGGHCSSRVWGKELTFSDEGMSTKILDQGTWELLTLMTWSSEGLTYKAEEGFVLFMKYIQEKKDTSGSSGSSSVTYTILQWGPRTCSRDMCLLLVITDFCTPPQIPQSLHPQSYLDNSARKLFLLDTHFMVCSLGGNVVESISTYIGKAVSPFLLAAHGLFAKMSRHQSRLHDDFVS